ncbi:MAG TPA: NADH:flavin oxidoreductase/NADH oxidase [Planctomycetia bacterium]|nr:NADH:flavin oxidoreductase/NADH oxidase [Planctomycetia bacterium]
MAGLFSEFRLKDATLRNRIAVSPMCQYSCIDGFPNDWHLVHLGSRAVGGAGLVIVEATAVTPEGRISPGDAGLWADAHVPHFERLARFIKQQGAVPGIQIAHAGRKASANKPWEGDDHLEPHEGAWETIAPSAIPFGANLPATPRAMTRQEIHATSAAFAAAAKRALAAGFEWLELHFAHGYLAHEFYSPLSNARTDEYGGSFENRIRFHLETIAAVREVWPERAPLTARISATDWADGGVTVEDSIELTKRFRESGIDLVDVSHGFGTPDISKIPWAPGFMIPTAERIRREADIPVAAGWLIFEPKLADDAIREGQTDLVMLARELLRDPYWPFHAAKTLGVETPQNVLPVQYSHWLKKR